MMRARSWGTAAAVILLAFVLAACGSLPTTGPVNAGQPIADDDSNDNLVLIPDGPTKDATPQQIVEGFIAAGSGPRDNWATAKEFLAPDVAWNPRAGVTVYSAGQRELEEVAQDEFILVVTPAATVDATGELSTSTETGEISLPFTLAQQADGQWRITQAPDGIVLDRTTFGTVFDSYALQFFDPSWTYLVPDDRWFPRTYARTSIAEALVNGGPSPWLTGAVSTAFADGARLATVAVPEQSGVAAVSLQEGARDLDQLVLDRMQTQLEASLATAGVSEVDMLVDEQLLVADAVTVRRTTADTRPLVLTDTAFGFLSGTSVEEITGLSAAILETTATDIEVGADRTTAAVRDANGEVLAVDSDGTNEVLDDRVGLIAPSIDPYGIVWSVPQSEPAGLQALRADGVEVELSDAWPGASEVLAQRVSRDGTRLAAVVRTGDEYALWVAAIQRDREGVPTVLGVPKVLATLPGKTTALTWVDSATVAVVTEDDGDLYLYTHQIGGFGTLQRSPDEVTALAGGTQSGGVRVRDAAGELYGQRSSNNWQHLASGIRVLAIQQGSPR